MTTPETLNRSEAHRRLLAIGMPADLAGDCLDHEQVRYANATNYPGAWPILAAYRRHCAAHEGIVERAIRLDREATARACGPDLTPAEEAEIIASAPGQIGPGQTPIGRPPSLIADAFAATLWLLAALLGESPAWTLTAIRALRPLIQRAAEEHARQNRYFVRAATSTLDGDDADDAAAYAEEHASRPVTDADLADIEARTSGPGPLAEDGALLRRCVAEIRALRKGRREAAQTLIAEIGAAGPEDIEQAAARAIAQIREQDAEIDRWKTAVVSKASERDVAVTENGRLRSEVERLTAKLAGIEGVAAQGDGMMTTISEQAAEIERLTRELAATRAQGALAAIGDPSERPPAAASLEARAKIAMLAHDASPPAVFGGPWENAAPECHAAWIAVVRAVDASRPGLMCAECHRSVGRDVAHIDCEAPELGLVSDEHGYRAGSVDSAVATVVRAMGRPGLTEEEALATAGPLSRDIYNRIGLATGNKIGAPEWMRDAIATALLRASRGALARGDVAVPRAALESLVKATQYEDDVRDAREVAKRVLHQDFLRHEPARTDPEAARALAEARAERDSGDASLEADDPSPIERLAREFDRAAFKQGCGAINHDRGDCYRDAAKRMRAVAAEYLGLTEEQTGNVQSVRRRLGLTQERLGVEIGYRSETISRWENGHEAVPRVVRLALIGLIASHGEHDANRGAK